jgi:predicted metalloprotease
MPKCYASFRTNESRTKYSYRTTGSNCKELEEQAFVETLLADNEDVWTKIFNENNLNYKKPNIVLFIGGVETGCGMQHLIQVLSIVQQIQKVYMFAFFEELKTRFGAQGEFYFYCLCVLHMK